MMTGSGTHSDPLLNQVLGGCRIEACLGRGGMGAVYRAYHIALDKRVAVKVLSSHLSEDPDYVARFFLEARSAAKLEHPNVVQVLNVGEDQGRYFIVMQYVEGDTLEDLIRREGRLPLQRATRLVRDIAGGLAAAHKQGIVHRDIKPANILISPGGSIRIADFGLARQMERKKGLTIEGTFMGTPEYVSPEQAEGKALDHRSDLYSLGIVYYELLAGKVPFQDGSAMDIAMKQMREKPRPLLGVDPGALRVVMRLLEKDAQARYPSADALLRDLDRVLAGGRVSAPPAPTMPPSPAVAPAPGRAPTPAQPAAAKPATRSTVRGRLRGEHAGRWVLQILYLALLLASAGAFLFLGGTGSAAASGVRDLEVWERLVLPFRPQASDFVLNLCLAGLAAILFAGACIVNRGAFHRSPSPVASIVATGAGMVFLYAGAFLVPSEGGGAERALAAFARLKGALVEPAALLAVGIGIFLPVLLRSLKGGMRMFERVSCVAGTLGCAACLILFASMSLLAETDHEPRAGSVSFFASASVCLGFLATGLYLLLTPGGGGQRGAGGLLVLLSLAAAYACAVTIFAPDDREVVKLLSLPFRALRERWQISGLPAVLGAVLLAWGLLFLYYRPSRSHAYA